MHRTSGENQNKFVQFSVLSTSTTCLEIDPALALSRRSQYVGGGEGKEEAESQILRCYRGSSLHLVQCIPRQHDSGRQFICGLVVTVRQAVVTLLSDCGGVDWTAERRVYTGLFYTEMRTVYSVQSSTLD